MFIRTEVSGSSRGGGATWHTWLTSSSHSRREAAYSLERHLVVASRFVSYTDKPRELGLKRCMTAWVPPCDKTHYFFGKFLHFPLMQISPYQRETGAGRFQPPMRGAGDWREEVVVESVRLIKVHKAYCILMFGEYELIRLKSLGCLQKWWQELCMGVILSYSEIIKLLFLTTVNVQ